MSKETTCPRRILAFATQGSGGDDEARLRVLLSGIPGVEWFAFNRSGKLASARALTKQLWKERPDLVVMEGTGIAGGLPLLVARLRGVRYVFSSGDAVGPFVAGIRPILGPLFGCYERLLCRFCSGFVGWTPYLVGRALTFGAPRAMTAPGWAPSALSPEEREVARAEIRDRLGIPRHAKVIGIVGSLAWTKRVGYCYGLELVRALERVERDDVWAVIVGDGAGFSRLESIVRDSRLTRCRLTGRVPREEVPRYLAALDLASLPQSVDRVGSFRYTTKISEYLAAGLPVVTGEIPLAYDLDGGWVWRLPGQSPWDERYVVALAQLLESLEHSEIESKKRSIPSTQFDFDRERQRERFTRFIEDLTRDV